MPKDNDFGDLAEYLDPDFYLTIRSKTYRIPDPGAVNGAKLSKMFWLATAAGAGAELTEEQADQLDLGDDEELDFYRMNLGAAYDEMLADNLPQAFVSRAGQTAYLYWNVGKEAALDYWRHGELTGGKAPAAGRPTTATRAGSGAASSRKGSRTGTRSTARSTTAKSRKKPAKPA